MHVQVRGLLLHITTVTPCTASLCLTPLVPSVARHPATPPTPAPPPRPRLSPTAAQLTCAYTNNYPGFKVSVTQTTASAKDKGGDKKGGGDKGGGDGGKGGSSAPPPSAPRANATALQQQPPRPQPIIVNINNFNTQPNATDGSNATLTSTSTMRGVVIPSGGQRVGGGPQGCALRVRGRPWADRLQRAST